MQNLITNKRINFKKKYDYLSFYIGVFLLPSAVTISIIFLLFSSIINTAKNEEPYFKDKWNIPFFVGGILLIISCLVHTFFNQRLTEYSLNPSLSWIGLANWVPFFWCFWGFKSYLNSQRKRRVCCSILIAGTFPVIISGFGQYFLNWHGPMNTLYGLIVWYQRPLEDLDGMTGLFNNPNYLGTWMNLVWPFCLALIMNSTNKINDRLASYFFILSISTSIILTNSRAAWIGLIIGTSLMLRKKAYKYILGTIIIISSVICLNIFPLFGDDIQNIFRFFIPESIILEFSDFQYSRLGIWINGAKYALQHPIFGSGAGSFTEIFLSDTGLWKGHAHNLPLELIISYGLPASLFILLNTTSIIYLTSKKIFSQVEKILFQYLIKLGFLL